MNPDKLSQFLLRQRILLTIHRYMYPVALILFIGVLGTQIYATYETSLERDLAQSKLEQTEVALASIKSSLTALDDATRKQYQDIYLTLVPIQDNIFTMLASIDYVVRGSGLEIIQFTQPKVTASAKGTKVRKSAITVSARGTKAQLETFLSRYRLGSVRFATLDSLLVDEIDDVQVKVSLTLSFYSAPSPTGKTQLLTYTQRDQDLFVDFDQMINRDLFVRRGTTGQSDYDTRSIFEE